MLPLCTADLPFIASAQSLSMAYASTGARTGHRIQRRFFFLLLQRACVILTSALMMMMDKAQFKVLHFIKQDTFEIEMSRVFSRARAAPLP